MPGILGSPNYGLRFTSSYLNGARGLGSAGHGIHPQAVRGEPPRAYLKTGEGFFDTFFFAEIMKKASEVFESTHSQPLRPRRRNPLRTSIRTPLPRAPWPHVLQP